MNDLNGISPRPCAPNLKPRRRKSGAEAWYWICPTAPQKAGFKPSAVRLTGTTAEIDARARILNAECREWMAGNRQRGCAYDGSLGSLIRLYQSHPASPYRRLAHETQLSYDANLVELGGRLGARQLKTITGADIRGWHQAWLGPDLARPRVRKAHGLVTMLRILVKYGIELGHEDAVRLATILKNMRFEHPMPREASISRDQVVAIRQEFRRRGYPSAALAVAIQYECVMRQKDVIGEWLPCDGASISGAILDNGRQWATGLLWGVHIDSKTLILTKPTSKSRGRIKAQHDLRLCQMVVEELADYPRERRIGPVIINETTGKPWKRFNYRRMWASAAAAVGLPPGIWNMDLRAGGITEGLEAGADITMLGKAATHTQVQTTQGYVRDTLSKSRKVASLRARKRDQNAR